MPAHPHPVPRRPRAARRPARAAVCALALALAAGLGAPSARADDAATLRQLRATTLALIDALVAQGLLSRERADALLRQAAEAGDAPTAPGPAQWGAPRTPAPNEVRVPYIPQSLRAQIKEEIKGEVMATANEEGWASPRALPGWLRGVKLGGDVRVRLQRDDYAEARYAPDATGPCDIVGGNLPATCYRSQTASPAWSPDLVNTTNDRDRLSLRARLDIEASIGSDTQAGLRLSTGSGPSSGSVTLGNGFDRKAVYVDRAFLRWEPRYNRRLFAGRMANPFFGSDLLWPDDLGLEGVAAQGELDLASGLFAFGTAGAFALQELATTGRDKWLYALQAGVDWSFGSGNALRVGLGYYDFSKIEGVRETTPEPGGALAGTTGYFSSQYPANLRLKGNTLIALNDPTSTSAPVWGLASQFRPVNLSARLAWRIDDRHTARIGADWVRNLGFDLADIVRRGGSPALAGLAERTAGAQLRLDFGSTELAQAGDWQIAGAWRRLERDAWVDAFTDTSWHGGGGTNYQGWMLGGQYAIDSRTAVGLRAIATRNLDDGQANLSNAPLRVETLQLDLLTRF